MTTIIPLLLSRRYLSLSMVAFLLIAVIVFLGDLVYMVRSTSDIDIPTSWVALLSLFRLPELVMVEMLPIVVLMGSTLATLSLVKTRVLLVVQGYGLSLWMLLIGPLVSFGFVGLLVMLLLNPLSSFLFNRHVDILREYESQEVGENSYYSKHNVLWFQVQREGGLYLVIRLENLDGRSGRIRGGAEMILFDEKKVLLETTYAREVFVSGKTWQLTDVTRVRGKGARVVDVPIVFLVDMPSLEELSREGSGSYRRSFFELGSYIEEAESIGFDVTREKRRYHLLLSLPFFLCGSMMSGMALASGVNHRGGGVTRVVTISLIFSVALFFVFKVLSFMAQAGLLPAWLSAWFLPLVIIFLSLGFLLRRYEM